jgi:hypothetical protein
MEMTWSPELSRWMSVALVAEPDAKARPNLPFSMAATHSSKAARVGLPVREYS